MSNPTYTRKSNRTLVLMRVGSTNEAAEDAHLTIGRGSGDHANYVGRAEVSIPEPTSWPSRGKLVSAILTVEEVTGAHPDWQGGAARIQIMRCTARPALYAPGYNGHGTNDYTTGGSGDKYPGTNAVGSEQVNVKGKVSKNVSALVEEMLPARILRRSGEPCGDNPYGFFQIRSVDESTASRSVVLSPNMVLTVEIDTRVTPGTPEILEVLGAQEPLVVGDPTLVATDAGTVLEVRFAFAAGPSDTAAKVQLELYGAGATDPPPDGSGALGTRTATTGWVVPTKAAGTNVYTVRLAGIAVGTIGRFRLAVISSSGKQSPWTSVEADSAYVELARIPGPPLAVKVTPYLDDLHILATINGASTDTVSGAQVVVTRIPQGTLAWDSGMDDIGGSTRSVDVDYGGEPLQPGQAISTVIRLRNQDGLVGRYSAPVTTTVKATDSAAPTLTPSAGRLLTLRPTFTIAHSTFDGYRLEVVHETDDSVVYYDTGEQTVVDLTTRNVQIPAGKLSYGLKFRARASIKPDGASDFTDPTEWQPYSIASLPSTKLSVIGAVNGKVGTQRPTWHREVTDPDGAAVLTQVIEVDTPALPHGTGTRIAKYVNHSGQADVVIPQLTIPWETTYEASGWSRNDLNLIASTTLSVAAAQGATSVTLTSASGFTVGDRILINSGTGGHSEERVIATLPGAGVATFSAGLEWAHAAGESVWSYTRGLPSPWITITALQPPTIDILLPTPGLVITRPWYTLVVSATPHGGRTVVGYVWRIYEYDGGAGKIIATLASTSNEQDIPAYLLPSNPGPTHFFNVTATDSEGMSTTSGNRFFWPAFSTPAPVPSVTAVADPTRSAMVVSWDASDDVNLHHYEVVWYDDSGAPVRIDGGPEELLDGKVPIAGTSLVHVGARLGDNTYAVYVHNGYRASEPTTATGTLGWSDVTRGIFEIVDAEGEVLSVGASDAPIVTTATMDPQQPLGGESRALSWGIDARRASVQLAYLPAEDGAYAMRLRQLMADPARSRPASPVWLKPAAGYLVDPLWAVLTDFTASPQSGGFVDVASSWLEVADPAHAILPVVTVDDSGVADIYSTEAEFVFPDQEI